MKSPIFSTTPFFNHHHHHPIHTTTIILTNKALSLAPRVSVAIYLTFLPYLYFRLEHMKNEEPPTRQKWVEATLKSGSSIKEGDQGPDDLLIDWFFEVVLPVAGIENEVSQ